MSTDPDAKLFALETDPDPRLREYAYRWDRINKRRITPAVYKGPMHPGIFGHLRDELGGGEFYIMVRRGETMEHSQLVSVAPSPTNAVAFSAFREERGCETLAERCGTANLCFASSPDLNERTKLYLLLLQNEMLAQMVILYLISRFRS
jgi:hypothetical protein